jgi:hypothetical protein
MQRMESTHRKTSDGTGWLLINSPIIFADNRFDYPGIEYIKSPEEKEWGNLNCPIRFVNKKNNPGEFREY